MKKLTIPAVLLFSFLSAHSQRYDFTSKSEISVDASIDINKAIQISNTDAIYNDVGLHYIGYGYWVAVGIKKDNFDYYYNKPHMVTDNIPKENDLPVQGGKIDKMHHSKRKFYQNGAQYVKVKSTFLHKSNGNFYPIMSRSEYMDVVRQNKELLEMGLMSQAKYEKELEKIKYNIENY